MHLLSNKKIEFKIAYKNLLKRPIRNIFTVISIILGVGIFFSVNIATDSLENSLKIHLDPSVYGEINMWIYLFRGILMIFSAISLIICVLIIKNLMEMSKEEQLYELGLLRAIGNS
jgi:ABC-type antimicrobial peptide transport system permease subunit